MNNLKKICIVGLDSYGMLSGTASMDFGGRRNVGIAVGIIDGFVYAGTAVMSFTYAQVLPEQSPDPSRWLAWPVAMIPVAALGTLLARRIWHATARPGSGH